jgi:hypothetical protein
MDYSGYIAQQLESHGKMGAFQMFYQTDPERAAKMAGEALMGTSFDVMPTMGPVSPNVQDVQSHSPELAGKTMKTETNSYGAPPDTTSNSHGKNKAAVNGAGYAQPQVQNFVGSVVMQKTQATNNEIESHGAAITTQVSGARDEAGRSLNRTDQVPGVRGNIKETPVESTVAGRQDKIHKDLFKGD